MKPKIMTVDLEPDLNSNNYKSMKFIPKLLDYFDDHKIKATFFTVTSLLEKYESEIKEISRKHEIASHSHNHNSLNSKNVELEIQKSKQILSDYGYNCQGFRAPKFITTKNHFQLLKKYNYQYDSSLATFLPGRYSNLNLKQKPFLKRNLVEFPIPNFIYPSINSGLTYLKLFHPFSKLFPQKYMFYLHPWEFLEKKDLPKSNSIIYNFLSRNSGKNAWKIFTNHIEKNNTKWISCQAWLEKRKLIK